MLGLLPGGLLPVQADLRITLAVRHTRHRKVHADLGALTGKVHAQPFDDLRVDALRHADNMLGRPGFSAGFHFLELIGACFAGRTEGRRGVSLVDIAADCAYKLFHCE